MILWCLRKDIISCFAYQWHYNDFAIYLSISLNKWWLFLFAKVWYFNSISDLHIKLKILSRNVPGLAILLVVFGVVDARTTCRLYDGPLLGLFFKCQLVCEFGMVRDFSMSYFINVVVNTS